MKFKIILISIFTVFLSACSSSPEESKVQNTLPNIILCMSDDHGWGDVSYYGHPHLKTPNFDAMAQSGLRLDRFYAAGPVCSPTRASVLTGRHPNRMRTFSFGFPIKAEEITIAQILKNNGYSTAHFGKWHLGSIRPESDVNPGKMGFETWLTSSNYFDQDPIFSRNGKLEKIKGEGSEILIEEVLEYIEDQQNSGKPYFIVIWFADPHYPHKPNEDFEEIYEDHPENLRKYYGEIASLDHAIGELREELKSTAGYKNTLLWYNGDNGGSIGLSKTGGRGQKGMLYEGGLRVPAIIEWPAKIQKARAVKIPTTSMDIFPTLLDAAEISWNEPRALDGKSLLPLIKEDTSFELRCIGFWKYATGIKMHESEYMHEMLKEQEEGIQLEAPDIYKGQEKHLFTKQYLNILRGHAVWLDWPWKLHRIKKWKKPVRIELYNLEDDPYEENNLALIDTLRVERMKKELGLWQRSVSQSAMGKDY